ncbi:phosphopentomutase [Marvinbryantia formatexigens DSM 14469]|uniref:Phosphopentomutase n=1 Tax=Marvinbryantia formatexigens DSM 14469 TaxID=478749 RepID=C6LIB6_9FIRM|nr:phosphopentomutase [Marvinbryantia formatexigens]EET59612.1 phosphopentomutase [Marvinbryantia formatexigens DSM 14469]UWO26281.1 phosphopentomutase [Marvinbryantia formatexigens DSM 14469]SDG09550.1 phosphopentomutase [Marvinbryantia formatexigens]
MDINRVFVIVLDSYGIGNAPDAADFGDAGANTLATIRKSEKYDTPNMKKLGLFCIDGVEPVPDQPPLEGAFGRLTEASRGKDTTIGHWEIAGIISEKPLPTYPDGFPQEVLDELEKATGRKILCNKPYSGTQVIADYGEEHMKTGSLIVYTSADSVLQIAAHEDVVPLETLYDYCHKAREIMMGEHSVGRVIARPFVGTPGNFTRTPHRHDYSLEPPAQTMMDVIAENGMDTLGVGKIYDIFAGKNIQRTVSITNNVDGMEKTLEFQKEDFHGLCFVNLVDFDMLYGHRNDIDGYANAATVFDEQLGTFMERMRDDDVLFITADHGCDPGYPGTDHTREQIPVLVYGAAVKPGVNLGTGSTYANIGATVLDMLGLKGQIKGESFYPLIKKSC